MSRKDRQSAFSFDRLFGRHPFWNEHLLQMNRIQEYVQHILERSLPWLDSKQAGTDAKPKVFETHRSVFVRVRVPKGRDLRQMRVRCKRRQLLIDGLVPDRTVEIDLPATVSAQGARCRLKGRILEAELHKPGHKRSRSSSREQFGGTGERSRECGVGRRQRQKRRRRRSSMPQHSGRKQKGLQVHGQKCRRRRRQACER